MSLTKFKIITGIIAFVLFVLIISRPNIFHPFSSHSAWEEGFKDATGMYPEQWNVKYPNNKVVEH